MAKRLEVMSGNETVARAAIAAGCRFYAGYPITPSSEIAEMMSALLPKVDGKFIQMEDEIGSMAATVGASLAGLKSMTATSGPGFSLKQENLGFAAMVEAPVVVVNVMRGGPSTGLPTFPAQGDVMQAVWGTHGDHPVVVITPGTLEEVYMETVRAFNVAEKLRVPVVLLLDEIIGHMTGDVMVPDDELEIIDRPKPTVPPEKYLPYDTSYGDVPPMGSYFEYPFHTTGLHHDETGFPTTNPEKCGALIERMHRKVFGNRDWLEKNIEETTDDAEILVFAFGSTGLAAEVAVKWAREQGIKAGLLRPLTLWPFPEKRVNELAKKAKAVVVAEMNLGMMIREVERAVNGVTPVYGVLKANGQPIEPPEILAKIKEVA